MKFSYFLLLLTLINKINYCTCENENELIKSLLKEFKIQHCIIVDIYHNQITNLKNAKYFARENFYTTTMTIKNFYNYLKIGEYLNAKTAIIIKTNRMIKIFKNYFHELNANYVMSPAIWILIDKTTDDLAKELRNVYIPYNCEFLIITPINETFYKINDLYNIGLTNYTQRQKHRLGNWSEGRLTITRIPKEIRRFNMWGEKVYVLTPFMYPCWNPYGCYYAEILWWIGRVMNSTGYFHIKDDVGEEHGFSAYLAPFSRKLWRFIIYVLLATSVTSILIERYKQPKITLYFKIFSSFIAAIKPIETLCNQCGSQISDQTSSRLTWLSIRLTASLLVPAYSAAVISFITISIPKLPFTDLTTFLQDGTYKTSGVDIAYSHSFFIASSDPINQEITQKLLLNETPGDDYEAMNWICGKDFKYAYVGYNNNDMYKFPHNECKVRKIPNPIFSIYTGLQMRLYSPYRKVYNLVLYRFYTSGVLHKMKLGLVGKMPEVQKEDYMPLELNRIMPLHYIVILGIVLSFFFLLIEMLLKD